jgi:hypothetical protein
MHARHRHPASAQGPDGVVDPRWLGRSRRLGRLIAGTSLPAGVAAMLVVAASAQVQQRRAGGDGLRQWVFHLASDELQGRALHSSGLGLAAGYITERLRAWDLKPAGDAGSYLQTVRVHQVTSTNRSTLTVTVGTRQRTFAHGDGVFFQPNVGGARRVTIDRVEFVGYGLDAPPVQHEDLSGRDVRGAAVIWLGRTGPKSVAAPEYRRVLAGRHRAVIDRGGAAASLGPPPTRTPQAAPPSGGGTSGTAFTTVQPLDAPVAPTVYGTEALYEFMFSQAPMPYPLLAGRALAQESLPHFRLDGVSLTFDLEAEYRIERTELAHNIVALVEGRDPALRHQVVGLGAHYDHLGYAPAELVTTDAGQLRPLAPGPVTAGAVDDRIWNGADDNASGTAALMALARAYAATPPRRSMLFVWHTAEERGLLGSRYFVEYPTVRLDRLVAFLNLDMIGRNRNDQASERNTVYLVGSDRLSSELDAITRAANASLARPLTISEEFNDPAHLEQLAYRSDHFSYAAKGIPFAFFTTGPHPDYHTNTDHASKIEFEKLQRVTDLVFATATMIADRNRPPARGGTTAAPSAVR